MVDHHWLGNNQLPIQDSTGIEGVAANTQIHSNKQQVIVIKSDSDNEGGDNVARKTRQTSTSRAWYTDTSKRGPKQDTAGPSILDETRIVQEEPLVNLMPSLTASMQRIAQSANEFQMSQTQVARLETPTIRSTTPYNLRKRPRAMVDSFASNQRNTQTAIAGSAYDAPPILPPASDTVQGQGRTGVQAVRTRQIGFLGENFVRTILYVRRLLLIKNHFRSTDC